MTLSREFIEDGTSGDSDRATHATPDREPDYGEIRGGALHILLASEDDESDQAPPQPTGVRSRWELDNPGRGVLIELCLYSEGLLRCAQTRRGKRVSDHMLDLRYIDARPSISRFVPKRCLRAALGLAVSTGACGLLAYFGLLIGFTLPLTLLGGTATIVTLLLCAYRTEERADFHTLHGRGCVLTLSATVGCIRALRALIPQLAGAIRQVHSEITLEKSRYLRKEMSEHYRLKEAGVISDDDCMTCTRRILGSFD